MKIGSTRVWFWNGNEKREKEKFGFKKDKKRDKKKDMLKIIMFFRDKTVDFSC